MQYYNIFSFKYVAGHSVCRNLQGEQTVQSCVLKISLTILPSLGYVCLEAPVHSVGEDVTMNYPDPARGRLGQQLSEDTWRRKQKRLSVNQVKHLAWERPV